MNIFVWLIAPIIFVLAGISNWHPSMFIEILLFSFLFVFPLIAGLQDSKQKLFPKQRFLLYCDRLIETGILMLVSIIPWILDTRAFNAALIKTVFGQCIVYTIAFAWMLKILQENPPKFVKTPLNVPIILFWLWCLVTTFISQYRYASLEKIVEFSGYFLLFFIVINNIKEKVQVQRIITTFMLASSIVAVYGLLQYFGFEFVSWPSHIGRVIASLGNPDFYAGFLCITLPICIAMLLNAKTISWRIFYIVLAILQTIGLYLTFTRGGWVAIPLAIILFFILKLKAIGIKNFFANKKYVILSVFLLVFAVISISVLFLYKPLQSSKDRFLSILPFAHGVIEEAPEFLTYAKPYPKNISQDRIIGGGNQEILLKDHIYRTNIGGTAGVRVTLWYGAWRMFLENPFSMILGRGLGTFWQAFPPFRPPYYHFKMVAHNNTHAHSEYMEILSEQGIIGLGLFFWIIFVFFMRQSIVLKFKDSWAQNLFIGFACAVLAVLFENLASVNLRWASCAIFFWFSIGMAYAVQNISGENPKEISQPKSVRAKLNKAKDPIWKFLLPFVAFIFLLAIFTHNIKIFLSDVFQRSGALSPNQNIAIEEYNKGIKYAPNNFEIYYKLAFSYAQTGQWDKARECYLITKKLAPDYYQLHYNLGVTYSALGDIDNAIKEFEKAVEQDWSNYLGFYNLGLCYEVKKDMPGAKQAFENAVIAKEETHKYIDNNISADYPEASAKLNSK